MWLPPFFYVAFLAALLGANALSLGTAEGDDRVFLPAFKKNE